ELTRTTLENYGYRVVTALNGLQAIDSFAEQQNEIKLLVTDSDVPIMDGVSAMRTIQQIRPDVQVIVASGARRDTQQLRLFDTTHVASLAKPYTVEQLLNAVAKAICCA